MNLSFSTEYSNLFIFLCVLCGAIYAFALYFRERSLNNIASVYRIIAASLRFVLVSILCFLLLSPISKNVSRTVEKPIVAIVQDNSASIVLTKDSTFYKTTYLNNLHSLSEKLSEKYDVRRYSVGNSLEQNKAIDFTDKQTNLSDFFEEAQTVFSNVNIGAVLLASDGIYNNGSNPLYSLKSVKAPVYTIALGDTAIRKDMAITKVSHNRLAYLGNIFPVEVLVNAKLLTGESAELSVFRGNEKVYSTTYIVSNSNFSTTIPIQLEAKTVGLQRYKVVLTNLKEESSYVNNQTDFFIEVLDSRQKVLLVYDAPHPDVTAIKSAIDANQNYEITVADLASYENVKKYNLIIYCFVNAASNKAASEKLLTEASEQLVPMLLVGNPGVLSANIGVKISKTSNRYNEVEPVLNKNFSLFTLTEEFTKYAKNFPALSCPFGTYEVSNGFNTLFYQKIGSVETQQPAIGFFELNAQKVGVVLGEGLWRWKLREYADRNNSNLFNELIQKFVQYLSVKEDKSFFRVQAPKNNFENEPIEIQAEIYNSSYELVNDADVSFTITNEQGNKYPFLFAKTGKSYSLNAGYFPVGEYKYEAEAVINGKKEKVTGVISTSPLLVENTNTTADHQLLYQLAAKTGGAMYYPNQLDKLQDELLKDTSIKSIIHNETKLEDLINKKFIFFILLLLVSIEWFIRKYNGSY
ncbi:MAG: hypothetical protein J0M08_09300 [Bacteroidetes bacterium]|nr:hypothetical protein [Bacteroidota bacterium]